jgi:hypothetical protein
MDSGEPGIVLRFGLSIAFVRSLAEPLDAKSIAPLPFDNQILPLARQRRKRRIVFGAARRHLRH